GGGEGGGRELCLVSLSLAAPPRGESIGRKIREAEVRKLPYMLVVGDQEEKAGEVAVRRHREGDLGSLAVAEFAAARADEIAART
ncbi:MAG: His/Gly/Thr/Pro-type tRNA ligase C-terminal domain-containing protein, partial [Thermoleophilaceae bacterium]